MRGLGHLGVFFWGLVLMLAFSGGVSLLLATLSLGLVWWLYPNSARRLLNPRWLVFLGILAGTVYVFSTETDPTLRWLVVAQMTLRGLGLIALVNGVTSALEITEIAALFEKMGLKGLGFSLGVAFNLLPILNETSMHAWRSLILRGGLRYQRWRGLQLFLVTVVSNALRRAEETALAAEARAFDPQQASRLTLSHGPYDWLPWLGGLILFTMAGLI